ncbi:MAG: aldehyde dehydrogenase family protein [Acidobacteriota bacterium]
MTERNLPLGACWIQGEERPGDEETFIVDPSTGEVFARAVKADAAMVDHALTSAREAFKGWRGRSAHDRAAVLHTLAEHLRKDIEEMAGLVCREAGKPLRAARDEVLSAAALIDYFAEEGFRLTGRIPLLGQNREQVLVIREPVGVVAAITPFNYPLSTLACKAAPALAAGCTVVAKPDEHTPLSSLRFARLASEAGLPPGAFNVVTGPGPETGHSLVDHPTPRLVTFTGSTHVGKAIQSIGAKWVRRTILELGGQCPAIVCADAPWPELIGQLVTQSFKNSGQYCYRTSRIYVAEKIYEDFLAAFIRKTATLKIGPASAPDVDLGPLNNAQILGRVRDQVERATRSGARIEYRSDVSNLPAGGFYHPATVLSRSETDVELLRDEVFGPVTVISPFREIEDGVRMANEGPYGLAAYLFTKDLGVAMECSSAIEAGSIWVNRIHQAYHEAPFGGMKESGLGREKSAFGIEEFTELKTIYLSY